MKTGLDKILSCVAEYLNCSECPYETECEKSNIPECADVLNIEIKKELRESLLKNIYLELDKALEKRQIKEPDELKNGIILARLELLDYVRKRTDNE